jgi:predicted DNA-binding protein YlxM (UPF0122 family)
MLQVACAVSFSEKRQGQELLFDIYGAAAQLQKVSQEFFRAYYAEDMRIQIPAGARRE